MVHLIRFLIICILFFSLDSVNAKEEVATFAGGCFWCVQSDFDKVKGVLSTTAGYTGGTKKNPTYKEVSAGGTGHVEAVQIVFDPSQVSYKELLDVYFHNIDPTRDDGQFCDKGDQYRPVIFYYGEKQKKMAEEYERKLKIQPIKVQILPSTTFYPAEEYHQKYYQKNPIRYHFYRKTCGRDARLKQIWGYIRIES